MNDKDLIVTSMGSSYSYSSRGIFESSNILPPVGHRVLGFCLNRNGEGGYWDFLYFIGDGWEDSRKIFIFSMNQVPLWQPLPTIPNSLIKEYDLLVD